MEIILVSYLYFQNVSVHRSVKPQILSVFGDIALAIGPYFKNYLEVVLTTLQQASQAQVDKVIHYQGLHRLEKYLNLEDFEKSLKIKLVLKSTGNHSKVLKSP